jgi:hypothetical protein
MHAHTLAHAQANAHMLTHHAEALVKDDTRLFRCVSLAGI